MPENYFDHAAACPLMPEAFEAMKPFLTDRFGNPHSIHSFGTEPVKALEQAREQIARFINAPTTSIVFTASASESNNLALKGLARAREKEGRHIVISAIEHQSVLKSAHALERLGFEVTEVKVDEHGIVHPKELEKAIRPDTILVSVQHASNEIGTIQPLAELAQLSHQHTALIHSDGTAATGRIPVDVTRLGVDSYAFSAQSFYGPKGAAALYLKTGTRPVPLIEGGVQEKGYRAGTEDIPSIVGMGKAAEVTRSRLAEWSAKMGRLSKRLLTELPRKIDQIVLTGHPEQRLPGHVSLCVEFIEGEAMLLSLDDQGIAAASGSACTARTLKASHVLLAIGLLHAVAQSSLVLTMGKDTTDEDIDHFLAELPPIVDRLRAMSPLYAKFKKGEDPYEARERSFKGGH